MLMLSPPILASQHNWNSLLIRRSPRWIAHQRVPHIQLRQAELPGDLRWLDVSLEGGANSIWLSHLGIVACGAHPVRKADYPQAPPASRWRPLFCRGKVLNVPKGGEND
jgi:hypothetical protein